MRSTIFNDDTIRAAVAALDSEWLHAPDRTPLQAVQAVFGPHVTVIEHDYATGVRAYVVTCLSTHRAFLVDADAWSARGWWHRSPDRRGLLSAAFAAYEEATDLLSLAAAFAEPGYPVRRSSGRVTAADRFVRDLAQRWYESRAVVGDVWDPLAAAVFAGVVGAAAVVPYLPEAMGSPAA